MEFPPQSPVLTPLDFYLWRTLENTMYTTKPQTMDELRGQIEHVINDISLTTIQTVYRSIRRRCWESTGAKGDILNKHGLMEVQGIEHNTNCISVSLGC